MPSKPRLLIMDDDPAITEVVGQIARRLGWSVTEANSSDSFLLALKRDSFDAILTDYNMPEMNGLDVVRHLRLGGFLRAIIVMSGSLPEIMLSPLEELNVSAFLPKPFGLRELDHQLKKALAWNNDQAPVLTS